MVQLIRNRLKLKTLRKRLRRDQTDVESILWSKLRRKQLLGVKFHRQFSVGRYILDFFSPSLNLAIELDGGQHAEESHAAYDKEREKYLNSFGIKVIRFWNSQVVADLDAVLEAICCEINQPPSLSKEGTGGV